MEYNVRNVDWKADGLVEITKEPHFCVGREKKKKKKERERKGRRTGMNSSRAQEIHHTKHHTTREKRQVPRLYYRIRLTTHTARTTYRQETAGPAN